MAKAFTAWYTLANGEWELNHIEDGHVDTEKPTPKFPSQNGWNKMNWQREHIYIPKRALLNRTKLRVTRLKRWFIRSYNKGVSWLR